MDEKQFVPDIAEDSDVPAAPKKRKKKWWVILLALLLALVLTVGLVAGGAYWWLHRAISDNVQSEDSYTDEELDVKPKDEIVDNIVENVPDVDHEEVVEKVSNVHNIALFGVDQKKGSVGRSDAMIILSIDKENNKIKMTSLARDSLVPIDGHGEEKLTHAWAYGHAKLATKTINQAFGMNITDYVYVNFEEFINVIDYIGGVEVHVNALELETLNYTPDKDKRLPGTGVHRLNGEKALQYSRIRSDSDTNRTARQREVLIAMYEQVRKQPISKLPETVKRVLRSCHTNLSSDTILDIARWAVTSIPTIESLSMPNDQLKPWGGILDRQRGWVRVYDLDAAKKVLYNFIYEVDAKITGVTEYVPEPTEGTEETTTTTATTP